MGWIDEHKERLAAAALDSIESGEGELVEYWLGEYKVFIRLEKVPDDEEGYYEASTGYRRSDRRQYRRS